MKNNRVITLVLLGTLNFCFSQGSNLEKDQNPNYQLSLDKYLIVADSLIKFHGVTLQETYKAYDWREAREEKRELRRSRRQERRLIARRYAPSYYYGTPYYYGSSFSFGYGNYYRNRYNHFPMGIGIRLSGSWNR